MESEGVTIFEIGIWEWDLESWKKLADSAALVTTLSVLQIFVLGYVMKSSTEIAFVNSKYCDSKSLKLDLLYQAIFILNWRIIPQL